MPKRSGPASSPGVATGVPHSGTRSQGVALVAVLVVGVGIGFATRANFWESRDSAAPGRPAGEVRAAPQALVVQPADVSPSYTINEDANPSDPGNTNARARYSVVITRKDAPHYLAENGVNLYDSDAQAAAALHKLLGVGKFGTELPMRGALGDEAHLYAARDRGVVIGSVLWRQRNSVSFLFVYNPYPDAVPVDQVDRLARANAYDDTLGFAESVSAHLRASTG